MGVTDDKEQHVVANAGGLTFLRPQLKKGLGFRLGCGVLGLMSSLQGSVSCVTALVCTLLSRSLQQTSECGTTFDVINLLFKAAS